MTGLENPSFSRVQSTTTPVESSDFPATTLAIFRTAIMITNSTSLFSTSRICSRMSRLQDDSIRCPSGDGEHLAEFALMSIHPKQEVGQVGLTMSRTRGHQRPSDYAR